jgi:hypothetical protein
LTNTTTGELCSQEAVLQVRGYSQWILIFNDIN